MGFFGRGKKQDDTTPAGGQAGSPEASAGASAGPARELPPLLHDPVANLEQRVLAALARAGAQGEVAGPGEIRVDGFRLYLDNLRGQLAGRTPADQETEIERWVQVLLRSQQQDDAEETFEDIRSTVYPRVMHLQYFSGMPDAVEKAATVGIRLTEELVVLPGIDYPDRVGVVTEVDKYGGWDTIWPVAIANLQGLPLPKHTAIPGQGNDPAAGTVHLLETDDFFGASRVLLGENLLAAVLGHPVEAPHGMLVVMPSRHLLALHVITRVAGTGAASTTLAKIARAQLPGPLTDVVHYRSPDGAMQQLTEPGVPTSFQVTGAFGEVMERLTAAES